jgi:leader peptidase (prepilin peptidase)/N-methyltransferase
LTRAGTRPKIARGMPAPDWSLLLRTPAFETTALLFGLVVGSFANVCIHRLPLEREPAAGRFAWAIDLWRQVVSVVHPPSHCPRCGTPIRPWDNVPLVSWLALRGRCRSCRAPIAWRYPAVEAANGVLWLALAVTRGPTLQTAVAMLLVTALLVLALVDLEHQILPDAVTLPGVAVGLAASLLPGSPVRPLEAALAAGGGWLAFALVALAWKKLRGVEALGQGDWKMAALLGAFLGGEKLLLVVFLASAAGALVGLLALVSRKGSLRSRLPLGTFLGLAGIVVVFFGEPMLTGYGKLSFSLAEALFGWLWGRAGG